MIEFDTPLVPGANARLSPDHLRPTAAGVALVGQRCQDCGRTLFPKTGICPGCRSENLADAELPAQGTLYSWSVVHAAPKPWRTPYTIGYVDLAGDVRVFSHIAGDPAALRVGMPVALSAAPEADDGAAAAPFVFQPTAKENA